jgi:UDP-N-acetylmuramyl tripeptide synthase
MTSEGTDPERASWSSPPPDLSWRLCVALLLGRLANRLSRLGRFGSGTTIGGRVVLTMAPDAMGQLAGGRVLACVSGTNGKSTTTRMLTAAVSKQWPALSNLSGANLPAGLASALAADLTAPAVLEVDEMFLPRVLPQLRPRVVVLLNLSRDQLDRTADPHSVAAHWADAVRRAPQTLVIANCDDPRIVWAASAADQVVWVGAGLASIDDCQVCPGCGSPLSFSGSPGATGSTDSTDVAGVAESTTWSCVGCDLHRPAAEVRLCDGRLTWPGHFAVDLRVRLPGEVNISNAAIAVTAAAQLGVPPQLASAAASEVTDVQGRYGLSRIAGRACRLLLAKNPAGWAATLDLMGRSRRPLLLSLNAEAVDGRDTSWLYDVPFQRLRGRTVVVTGKARADLSLRLTYAGVEHETRSDPLAAVRLASSASRDQLTVDAVADYSGFAGLRRHGAAVGSSRPAPTGPS